MKGNASMDKSWLEGRWRIVSWRQEYDDGRTMHPFGESLEGYIEYRGNLMACVVSKSPRTPFHIGGQWDASDRDKAQAYNEYLTYSGRYEFDGEKVTHHIELSLFPSWCGTSQTRKVVRLGEDEVTLQARVEEGTPEARTAILSWRREAFI